MTSGRKQSYARDDESVGAGLWNGTPGNRIDAHVVEANILKSG